MSHKGIFRYLSAPYILAQSAHLVVDSIFHDSISGFCARCVVSRQGGVGWGGGGGGCAAQ